MENPKIRFKGFTKDWEQRKLNEVGVVIDPHPSHRAPKEEQGGIPFIGIGDVDEMGNINRESARPVPENVYDEHHKRYDLNVPSLGLGRVASLGKVIRLRSDIGKYAISPTISVLQFSENINIDYLYAYMNTPQFKKQFEGKSNGSTRQSVGTEMVRLLNLSMPFNLDEQKAIGTFYKNLDNLITLHQRKCEQTKKLKKYMLQKMFPQNGAKVPEIRFDGFTYDWEQRKLDDVVEFLDTMRKPLEGAKRISGSYPYYGASGIVDYVDGYLFDEELILLSEDGANITDRNYPVCFLASGKYWVNNHAHVLRTKQGNENNFICNSLERKDYTQYNTGMAMPKLNKETCKKIPILCPEFEEQKKIGDYFRSLDHLITLHQRKCDELKKMKKYMLQNMFI